MLHIPHYAMIYYAIYMILYFIRDRAYSPRHKDCDHIITLPNISLSRNELNKSVFPNTATVDQSVEEGEICGINLRKQTRLKKG